VVGARLEARGALDQRQRLRSALGRVGEECEAEQIGVARVLRVVTERALRERDRLRGVDPAGEQRDTRELGVQAREEPDRAAELHVRIERDRAERGVVEAPRDAGADGAQQTRDPTPGPEVHRGPEVQVRRVAVVGRGEPLAQRLRRGVLQRVRAADARGEHRERALGRLEGLFVDPALRRGVVRGELRVEPQRADPLPVRLEALWLRLERRLVRCDRRADRLRAGDAVAVSAGPLPPQRVGARELRRRVRGARTERRERGQQRAAHGGGHAPLRGGSGRKADVRRT
jgi:hypothetical protein